MKINWLVRFKNKVFWVTLIPMVFLLVQQICAMFGLNLDLSVIAVSYTHLDVYKRQVYRSSEPQNLQY